RARDRVHLHRHGHLGEHRADERRALTEQQAPEVDDPDRPRVDGVPAQRATNAAGAFSRIGGGGVVGGEVRLGLARHGAVLSRLGVGGPPPGARRSPLPAPPPRRSRSRSGSRSWPPCQTSPPWGRGRSPPQFGGGGTSPPANRASTAATCASSSAREPITDD